VQALPVIDDIQNRIGLPPLDAVFDRRQIRGGVQKRPILLLDQQWRMLGLVVEEYADRSLRAPGDVALQQLPNHVG
jgi:hypothetical protein